MSTLDTTAGRIFFADTGVGPTLLLVHVGMSSFIWRDLLRELAPHFRCVTFDAPGTGRSTRPGKAGTTLAAAAEAVGAVIDHLDLRDITLVVHDLGGPAGIAAAAERADRIAAIAAINTFAWRPAGAGFRGMLAVMGSAILRESNALTGWLPAAASTRFGVGRHWNSAVRKEFRTIFDREARRSMHHYLADARRADELFGTTERALRGPLADRPLMTVFGQFNDPLKLQPKWREMFPEAVQHVVPRGNHFPMCDAPADVAAWLCSWHAATIHGPR